MPFEMTLAVTNSAGKSIAETLTFENEVLYNALEDILRSNCRRQSGTWHLPIVSDDDLKAAQTTLQQYIVLSKIAVSGKNGKSIDDLAADGGRYLPKTKAYNGRMGSMRRIAERLVEMGFVTMYNNKYVVTEAGAATLADRRGT